METLDCVIVGAGVVGLAIARELALAGRDVIVLEKNPSIGMETSSRNSEVVHAGIYYPENSLKSRACQSGKKALYAYCKERNIPFKQCGKLIVATDPIQVEKLSSIKRQAALCGMKELYFLDRQACLDMEPELRVEAGLWSSTTGIVDSHTYMLSLQGDIENSGGAVVFNTDVKGASVRGSAIQLHLDDGYEIKCNLLINSAGLGAQEFCSKFDGFPQNLIPPLYLAKGNYFSLSGTCPFKHLIYPMPDSAGLGIHLTLDLAGQGRFGPNVKWVNDIQYDVDRSDATSFYTNIRKFWPNLQDGKLVPGYSGIRPKLVPEGVNPADFVIQGPREHGVTGVFNLFGIESPGLTASLSLAKYVAQQIK